MSNESITITQSIKYVTVAAVGAVGLNAGGLIQGNLEVDGNVVIDGLLTVGADTDGKDVRFWGETASKYTLWDASQDKLIITGDLQVDGTTTTINSTVVTIEDPVFTLGGATAPVTSDSKDRGIEFHYYDTDASAGKKGFFGWGNSDNAIKFLLNCADPSGSEIFTGDLAEVHMGALGIYSDLDDPAGNYERGACAMDTSGNLTIGTEAGGTGTAGNIVLSPGGDTVLPDDGIIRNSHTDRAFIKLKTWSLDFIYDATSMFHLQYANAIFNNNGADRDFIVHTTASNSLFVEGSSGNVGIGTASPAFPIDCVGTINSQVPNDTTGFRIYDTTNSRAWSLYPSSGNLLLWSSTGGDKLVVTSGGNVGIGVAVPATALSVNGEITAGVISGTPTNAVNALDSLGIGNWSSAGVQQFQIGSSSGTGTYFDQRVAGDMIFRSSGNTERMRLLENGNFGIGVAAPAYKLDVSGNVRIGDGTNPGDVQIYGTAGSTPSISCGITDLGAGKDWQMQNSAGNFRLVMGGGSTPITVDNDTGNVGIGTTDPPHLLHLSAGVICVDRSPEDAAFFNYKATADADTTSAISTLTTSGATTHHIQVDINGTKAWIAVSTNNPS